MKFVAEYIWIDGHQGLRSKSRTVSVELSGKVNQRNLMNEILNIELFEEWTYDGSSTYQAEGNDSEIILKPVFCVADPFRKAPNVLVLCDTYYPDGTPTTSNKRANAVKIFNKGLDLEPWFGLELEFYLMKQCEQHGTQSSTRPVGWYKGCEPQGQYYCSVGAQNSFGRKVAEQAYHLMLEAGISASGMNAEVGIGQWEIQVGPCEGINAADQFILAKYILTRVAELHKVQVNLDPKPIKSGGWNGSGCHINFSSKKMRGKDGYEDILRAVACLQDRHHDHMKVYGENNQERMTGTHETSNYNQFSFGVADRTASVRIPRTTEKNGCGYFEDRRPASNIDPYSATSILFETACLYEKLPTEQVVTTSASAPELDIQEIRPSTTSDN